MPFDPLTAGIEFAKTIAGKLADKYLPASSSETEKEQFRLETQKLVLEEIKLNTDFERVFVEDRKSAREREMTVKDKTPSILAVVSYVGFFGILFVMMFVDIPATARDPLIYALGALSVIITGITQYYYGSSSGSAYKNSMIEKLIRGKE